MSDHDTGYFDQPRNINNVIIALVVLCVVFVMADLFYHNDHSHFELETKFGFQAWFGFLAFVIIVFLGRGLRLVITRPEDYYDAEEASEYSHPVENEEVITRSIGGKDGGEDA